MTVCEKHSKKYIALSGGVGGAKLALGLSHALEDAKDLVLIANTGDDFQHMGLSISPDIDTLLYTLSGLSNRDLGWGREDESWNFMQACKALKMQDWFQLGDKDLALHVFRSHALQQGLSLTEITKQLCERFNIKSPVIPMTDDSVPTFVKTNIGTLPFQEYFVKHQCSPVVTDIEYRNHEKATMAPLFQQYLNDDNLQAVIICPSNPFLSIQPILSLPTLKEKLKKISIPVVLVSPIVEGQALKGPTSKLMQELDLDCSVKGIADFYADVIDGIIIDTKDSAYVNEIESIGIKVHTSNIIMNNLKDRSGLARETIDFSELINVKTR